MVRPLLDSLIAEVTEILKRDGGCDKKSTRNTEWCNSYVTEEVLICNWQAFLFGFQILSEFKSNTTIFPNTIDFQWYLA